LHIPATARVVAELLQFTSENKKEYQRAIRLWISGQPSSFAPKPCGEFRQHKHSAVRGDDGHPCGQVFQVGDRKSRHRATSPNNGVFTVDGGWLHGGWRMVRGWKSGWIF
jgi:hypothetical protein